MKIKNETKDWIKYLALSWIVMGGVVGYLMIPHTHKEVQEKYATIEVKYGKMPRDFAKEVRAHYKAQDIKMYEVTCHGVVHSENHNGWVSVCSYKTMAAGGRFKKRYGTFVINHLMQEVNLID